MSSAHPGWRFEVAPDTGHVPMLEAPRWTAEVIDDWMAAEGASAAELASLTEAQAWTGSVDRPPRTIDPRIS